MKNNNIKIDQVLETIATTSVELDAGILNGDFNNSEKKEILAELDKLEIQAYKAKFSVRLDGLKKSNPTMQTRDVLIHILAALPSDLSASVLTQIIQFVGTEWEGKQIRMAA